VLKISGLPIRWLPWLGALVIGLAFSIWYGGGNKTYAVWIGWLGVTVGFAFHLQKLVWEGDQPAAISRVKIYPNELTNFAVNSRTGVYVNFVNIGPGTAYDVTIDVSVAILYYPFPSDQPFLTPTKEHSSKVTLVEGDQVRGFQQLDAPITQAQLDAILDGNKHRVFVGAILSYRNSFGLIYQRRVLASLGDQNSLNTFSPPSRIAAVPFPGTTPLNTTI
jgi:hypothetical protein